MSTSSRAVISLRAARSVSVSSPVASALPAPALAQPVYVPSVAPVVRIPVPQFVAQWVSRIASAWSPSAEDASSGDAGAEALALAAPGHATALPAADAPELWDGLLLAAPKKKVSHSRKAMRSANKGLKDRVSTYLCATLQILTKQTSFTVRRARVRSCSTTSASTATRTLRVH